MANEDLFEGLQILSPQEIENSLRGGEDTENTENNQSNEIDNELTITPVIKPTEDIENKPDNVVNTNSEVKPLNNSELVYKALIKEMVDEGVLTVKEAEELETLPGNKESIKKLIQDTAEEAFVKKNENWKKGLNGEQKRFLEIEDAFDDTNKAIYAAQRLEFFDTIDEETIKKDVNLCKNLYYEQLTTVKKFSHEEALEAITDAEEVGKLENKALSSLPDLKKYANKEVEEGRLYKEELSKKEIQELEEKFTKLNSTIESKETIIEGLPLNKIQRDKLKANITTPVYKDDKGRELTSLAYKQAKNPVEFEILINYLDTLGLFNIDKNGSFKPDLSKIKNVVKTQTVSELDKIIASQEPKEVGRNTSIDSTDRQKGIFDLLERGLKNK